MIGQKDLKLCVNNLNLVIKNIERAFAFDYKGSPERFMKDCLSLAKNDLRDAVKDFDDAMKKRAKL